MLYCILGRVLQLHLSVQYILPGMPLLPLSSSGKVLVGEKSWQKKEFSNFLAVKCFLEGADDTEEAESDDIFRTDFFGSPKGSRQPFPMFALKFGPKMKRGKRWMLACGLVARLGAFVQIVGSHCTLRRQLCLHDLARQLCNYLGGKFSTRAARVRFFQTTSASLWRNWGTRVP